MVDNASHIGGHLPRPFILRYDAESKSVWVGLCTGQVADFESEAQMEHVRRMADSYLFSTLETTDGEILAAIFVLADHFFGLPCAPDSLSDDMRWLASETGHSDLNHMDLWWAACAGESLLNSSEDQSDQNGPPNKDA